MAELVKTVLKNDIGMEVTLVNFGARITSIKYPVIDKLQEMLVRYDSTKEFVNDPFYLGATCGRVCNRIENAEFEIDGQQYKLPANDGDNCLHGGDDNIALQYWALDQDSLTTQYAKFTLDVSDGHNGFPGNVQLAVTYQLSEKGALTIDYWGITDKKTPLNLTNHAYFNLGEKSCFDLQLKLSADKFLERSSSGIPTGQLLNIDNMGVDFTEGRSITELIDLNKFAQVKSEEGFDTCFVLKPESDIKAELRSVKNRVKMTVMTDQPSIQLYTGKFLDDPFRPYQGVCLECQDYVDATNQPLFPSILLSPGEVYQRQIVYKFSAY